MISTQQGSLSLKQVAIKKEIPQGVNVIRTKTCGALNLK